LIHEECGQEDEGVEHDSFEEKFKEGRHSPEGRVRTFVAGKLQSHLETPDTQARPQGV